MRFIDSLALVTLHRNRPKTGKGTMQTVNFCTNGVYDFIPIPKPEDADFLEIPPHKPGFVDICLIDLSSQISTQEQAWHSVLGYYWRQSGRVRASSITVLQKMEAEAFNVYRLIQYLLQTHIS